MKVLQNIALIPKIVRLYRNPFIYYLDKMKAFGVGKMLTVALRNGLRFKIHSGNSDINSLNEIFLSDSYEKIFSELRPDSTFIDMGANIGIVSVAAAARLTTGKVFAFEPNPEVLALLRENIALNKLEDRVAVYPLGVAGTTGVRTMYFEPMMWGGGRIIPDKRHDMRTQQFDVRCVGLGDALSLTGVPSIDFVKIDCEGAEGEILSGASRETFEKIGRVLVEYHEPHVSAAGIKAVLERNGFTVEPSGDFKAYYAERKAQVNK